MNYSSSRFTSISNHRPSPLLPRPLARYLLSVNLDSLHWMAHLDSSHHPGLFYEYGENLDISWPLTFSCIDSLQCGVSSFLGPWLLLRAYFLIYRVTDMDDFFALAFEGNPENQPRIGYYAQTFYKQKCHPTILGKNLGSLESKGNEWGPRH